MRSRMAFAAVTVALAGTACGNLETPNINAPSISDLTNNPTPSGIATAVQGLVQISRANAGGLVGVFGQFAREGYDLNPGNPPATIDIFVILRQDQNGNTWGTAYRLLRQGKIILNSISGVTSLSAPQKEGIRGFTKTLQAMGLLQVIMGLDASGAAIDVNETVDDPVPPIVGKAQVYARILQLLDEAATHLAAAGGSFAFDPPPGFDGFDTPASFLKFNKALRARANVYTKNWSAALSDLNASFLNQAAPLSTGVFWDFGSGTGDQANPVFDPTTRQLFAHPSILANAQRKSDGTKDNRALTKVAPITPLTRYNFVVSERLTIYTSNNAPIPIIRNEELILLRAEANLGLGNTSAAIADLNFIRANAGGLAPLSDPYVPAAGQPATLLKALLYEKRYSLLWEFGTSWIDARNYGDYSLLLTNERPDDKLFVRFAIPSDECDQRASAPPPGCNVNAIPGA